MIHPRLVLSKRPQRIEGSGTIDVRDSGQHDVRVIAGRA
jgi:hypothetical protein